MSITATTALIIVAQAVTHLITETRGEENARKIRDLKERAKLDALTREQGRDDAKFQQSRRRLLEIEREAHEYRLSLLEKEFENNFIKSAHSHALENYPLLISPYIIKNCILPFGSQNSLETYPPIPFCVLSNSNNSIFNKVFIPFLDAAVSEYVSSFWNTLSTHTACYYKGAWNEKVLFDDIHPKNIHGLMPSSPIILFTPYLIPVAEGHKIVFKVWLWGKDAIVYEPQGIAPLLLRSDSPYKINQVKEIVGALVPHLICLFGFYVDLYYWINSFMKPLLPTLLKKGLFKDVEGLHQAYEESYVQLLHDSFKMASSKDDKEMSAPLLLSDIVSVNIYHSPDKSVGLLGAAAELTEETPLSEKLIIETVAFVYSVRTGGTQIQSFDDINVNKLGEIDLEFIRKAFNIAKKHNLSAPLRGLSDVLKREIMAKPL